VRASKGEVNPGDPDAEAGEAEPERTEEALYDTSSFQKGKVTLCVNRGTVEADTNVGGIVGQVATEYDFDPEDDITLTGTESFDVEQTIKAVVRDSRNFGDITGKKDNVGGIVGKAEYGAIISCESYAPIESTGGSDVGGIAGSASYAIRSCYSMGRITGKNNIGGIAGEGCDIFYSYAYNDLDMSGENQGSIAGKVSDDGSLYGNYYVEGGVGGVDGIGYQGGATPLSYQELCAKDGVPEAFSQFTITFLADGEEVASYKCNYGDYLYLQIRFRRCRRRKAITVYGRIMISVILPVIVYWKRSIRSGPHPLLPQRKMMPTNLWSWQRVTSIRMRHCICR